MVLWVGLVLTLSQSSLAGLLVGLAILGALRFGTRCAAAAIGAASILKVLGKKPPKDMEDETLIMADQAEKAIIQVRESVKDLLQGKPTNGKVDELARLLSEGTWTHDFPITFEIAKALGLPVSYNIPGDVMKLMSLYPQPTRTQPTVEYLPVPRTRRPEPAMPWRTDNAIGFSYRTECKRRFLCRV